MNTIMKKILLLISLITVVVSCQDPYEEDITPAYEYYPLATYMEMDTTFTHWVELLKYADLFNTLNINASYTCFVPNDAAMESFFAKNNYSGVEDLTVEDAKYLIKYHTIVGSEYPQSLFDNGVIPDTTATGDFLSIEIREGGLNSIYVNGEARIATLDVEATNGIMHVIESVLTPVTEPIWGTMSDDQYSLFKEALQVTGYADMLNTISVEEVNEESGETVKYKMYYTVFAIPDSIFTSHGISSLSDLTAWLDESETDYTDEDNELNRFMAYHILDQQLDFASLATFSDDETSKNISTLATNELINVSEVSEALYLNYDEDSMEVSVSIIKENISTKNGMIHAIDNLMPIVIPPITTVTWELTDYSDIASLVSSVYRKSGVTSTSYNFFSPGALTSLEWEAIPASRNSSSVAYLVANKNDAIKYEMLNYDGLYLDLGLYGWIEMNTPAIIKGTYTMKVTYYSVAAATQYGAFLNILDGEYVGNEIITHGASTTTTAIRTTTIGEVTFDETTTHTLRILAGDDNAVLIDYIQFVPVN